MPIWFQTPAISGVKRKTALMTRVFRAALISILAVLPAGAKTPDIPFSGAQIDAAGFTGNDLPAGRSPLTAKVQMLLDRAGTSPGVVDGVKGAMSTSAIKAFERRMGFPVDGVLDAHVWAALQPYAGTPVTQEYVITDADAADLVDEIPTDYLLKANMVHLGYTSVAEKLGERFHMDERFIQFLNPGVPIRPGSTITVMAPGKRARGKVTRIIIDKTTRRVAAYDASGKMIADYPATIGSDATPSPSGNVSVTAVAIDPEYTYNPKINFQQGNNDRVLTIPPGPNGPVGTVWIALSKPTYGIHGTPTPSRLFSGQSYGCVRLTNWDADELAHMVQAGVTKVEFLEAGTSIQDVTEKVEPPDLTELMARQGPLRTSARPRPRTGTGNDGLHAGGQSSGAAIEAATQAARLASGSGIAASRMAEELAPEGQDALTTALHDAAGVDKAGPDRAGLDMAGVDAAGAVPVLPVAVIPNLLVVRPLPKPVTAP